MKNFKQLYQLTIKNILIKHKYISNLNEFKNLVDLYKTKKRVAKSQFKELANKHNLSKSDIKNTIQSLNKSNNLKISSSNINKLSSRINQIYTYYALLEYDNWTKCFTTMPEKRIRKKPSTSSFIHEFPLKVSKYSQRKYNIKFNAAKELYNAILGELFKRHNLMLSDNRYQHARELYKQDNSKAEAQTIFDNLRVEYKITKNDLQKLAKDIKDKCYMKDHLDSVSIQKLSDRVFDTYYKWVCKKGGKPRFKSWKNGIRSMEGKSNTCLSFKNNIFSWNGIKSEIILQNNDKYGVQEHALNSTIKFCRIVRKIIKGKPKFYLQLILEGLPKLKSNQIFNNGRNGIDIGVSTIASVGKEKALLTPFCQELNDIEKEIKNIQRKKARSLRLNNPDNYENDSWVIKDKRFLKRKGKNIKGKINWTKSNNYLKLENELKELQRLQASKRKYLHNVLVNKVLENGNDIIIEKNNYKAWQKGLYGKTIGKKAPSLFVQTLKRKALKSSGTFEEVSTWNTKFSQYCHVCDGYHKKSLSQRIHTCGENEITQRDLYSGVLLYHYDLEKKQVNRQSIIDNWSGIETSLRQALLTLIKSRNKGDIPKCLIPNGIEKRDWLVKGSLSA